MKQFTYDKIAWSRNFNVNRTVIKLTKVYDSDTNTQHDVSI